MIKITISHYTEKDMKAVFRTAGNNPLKIKINIIFILIFSVITITGFFIPSENISTKLICLSAVLIFCGTAALVQEAFIIPAQSFASFKNLQKHHGNSPICVCFHENHWTTSFGGKEESIKKFDYTSAYSAEETDEYFFISQQKNSYFCIPKRCLTENTPLELHQLLKDKLNGTFKVKGETND